MAKYWGVFIDETGCEFGASVEAKDKAEAWEVARENYPESRCVQLESQVDDEEREHRAYMRACWEYDNPGYDDN